MWSLTWKDVLALWVGATWALRPSWSPRIPCGTPDTLTHTHSHTCNSSSVCLCLCLGMRLVLLLMLCDCDWLHWLQAVRVAGVHPITVSQSPGVPHPPPPSKLPGISMCQVGRHLWRWPPTCSLTPIMKVTHPQNVISDPIDYLTINHQMCLIWWPWPTSWPTNCSPNRHTISFPVNVQPNCDNLT